jgi:enoyl-CoA hydratase
VREVTVERYAGVAVIRLMAPDRRNALTSSMARDLLAVCDEVDSDPQVGTVVVAADGPAFCAGAHRDLLKHAATDPAESSRYAELGWIYRATGRIGDLRVPSIAAVRGDAVGAGVNLVLATDLRVLSNGARIVPSFQRLGLHPGGGHFASLARLIGREGTAALGLFGEGLNAGRAKELGLAWEVLPEPKVEPRAMDLAARAAADPELARASLKSMRLVLGPPALSWGAAVEIERAAQMWSLRRKTKWD